MDGEKSTVIVKKIKKNTKQILQDPRNANLLLDLLNYSQSKNADVVCASCRSLVAVFSHFISADCFINIGQHTVAEADLSKEDQFSSWMREQFITACDVMSDHLCRESAQIQTTAFTSLVALLQVLDKKCPQDLSDKLIESIMSCLLNDEYDQMGLIKLLPSMLTAWSDKLRMCSVCLSHLRKKLKNINQAAADTGLLNCWRTIRQLASHDLDEKLKGQLTGVVCEFLKHKMPARLYREILTGISSVMDKMSNPLRLADFLSESFNIGGAVSLMSLHGLFLLMHKYNLDYPDFYAKLYSMFEPQVFGAKYRARFFYLADTFLTSTHLPAYVVAAFAKRLSRLCLHAPASGSHIAIPFISNLISRHPTCEVLLHRTQGPTELDTDPFLADETDLSQCRALDSCLWELQTLEHHYDPSLSVKAQKRRIAENDLSPLLENTSSDIIASEAKKIKKEIPVTFQRPRRVDFYL
ncbi:unnamed protein product [Candidula unifasciata]|uniref:CCAAT-binding factor domain-containing protein n=1 Tax=Candidula unifasciata TaxID=100452 RepID=A0A8S3Z5R3_9EUPU|nr:unnamed protein product [Candidula unifasciata]